MPNLVYILAKEKTLQIIIKDVDKSVDEKRREISNEVRRLTLKMSNQKVILTGYNTRIPERIALWRTTALNLCRREAKCSVGPLPTDWPYKITSSCFIPYSFFKQSNTASMSWYVLNSDGCNKQGLFVRKRIFGKSRAAVYICYLEKGHCWSVSCFSPYQWKLHILNNHSCQEAKQITIQYIKDEAGELWLTIEKQDRFYFTICKFLISPITNHIEALY